MRNQGVAITQRIYIYLQAILAAAVITVLLAGLQASTASAVNNTANTLKVSPVRSDIEVPRGESKTVKITVTNTTDEPITVSPIQNDFVAGDERGTPALILDEDKFAPSHSLKRFMKPLADVTIPANEAKTIDVVIAVPESAQAGGYFGAVRFAPAAPADGGQVDLSGSVASLILLTVPGDFDEKLELTNFTIQQNGTPGSFFMDTENLLATFRFANTSDVQLGPIGKVSVKKGDDVVYAADFNTGDQRDVILPDSARQWDVPLNDISGFGQYTVTATFTYGQENKTIEVAKSFWVIPLSVIIGAAIGLLVLAAVIVGIVLHRRNRKKHAPHGRGKVGFGRK